MKPEIKTRFAIAKVLSFGVVSGLAFSAMAGGPEKYVLADLAKVDMANLACSGQSKDGIVLVHAAIEKNKASQGRLVVTNLKLYAVTNDFAGGDFSAVPDEEQLGKVEDNHVGVVGDKLDIRVTGAGYWDQTADLALAEVALPSAGGAKSQLVGTIAVNDGDGYETSYKVICGLTNYNDFPVGDAVSEGVIRNEN